MPVTRIVRVMPLSMMIELAIEPSLGLLSEAQASCSSRRQLVRVPEWQSRRPMAPATGTVTVFKLQNSNFDSDH